MAGGGRRNAAGKAGLLSVMTGDLQWAFPAHPRPGPDTISWCSCNCQGRSGTGDCVVECELGLTLRQGKQQEQSTRHLGQAAKPPSPGSIQALAACGHGPAVGAVSSTCQTRGQMGQSLMRPPSTTWQGKTSPQQALLHHVHPPWPSLCTRPRPPGRAPPPGPPGRLREVSGNIPGYLA